MVDISITFPSIRNKNLLKVCNAINKACQKYTYEIIIYSPHNIPKEIEHFNIKWIKGYGSPSVGWQQCSILTNSEFLVDGSDDALFIPNILDDGLDFYKQQNCKNYDIVALHSKEGILDNDSLDVLNNNLTYFNEKFFYAHNHAALRKKCIDLNWKISLNFIIKTNIFLEIGGFNCEFEYINHSLHDFVFRIQSLGGNVYYLPKLALLVAHMLDCTGDHAPIHWAQTEDIIKFDKIYNNLNNVQDRAFIDINNWKHQEYTNWWNRRFNINNE